MSEDQSIALAKAFAEQKGWPWEEPIRARKFRRWWIGSYLWEIHSNANFMGRNVWVTIDDNLGEVISSVYIPR